MPMHTHTPRHRHMLTHLGACTHAHIHTPRCTPAHPPRPGACTHTHISRCMDLCTIQVHTHTYVHAHSHTGPCVRTAGEKTCSACLVCCLSCVSRPSPCGPLILRKDSTSIRRLAGSPGVSEIWASDLWAWGWGWGGRFIPTFRFPTWTCLELA